MVQIGTLLYCIQTYIKVELEQKLQTPCSTFSPIVLVRFSSQYFYIICNSGVYGFTHSSTSSSQIPYRMTQTSNIKFFVIFFLMERLYSAVPKTKQKSVSRFLPTDVYPPLIKYVLTCFMILQNFVPLWRRYRRNKLILCTCELTMIYILQRTT